MISVDAKKKELIGQFKNAGREWRLKGQPVATRTHDFPGDSRGKAVPYGIYDLSADVGWVSVGTDHDTAALAAESIRRWWKAADRSDYPAARRPLITADAGGSNGYRTRAWKAELAVETGLELTCCHFPPGTARDVEVEQSRVPAVLAHHDELARQAADQLRGHREHHRRHHHDHRAAVRAELDTSAHDTVIKISDVQMDALPLTSQQWQGDWNYTLRPGNYDQASGAPDPSTGPAPTCAWLCRR